MGTPTAAEKVTIIRYRIAICAVLLAALILVWLQLAAGIFGTALAV
jgi:hypothetical protein